MKLLTLQQFLVLGLFSFLLNFLITELFRNVSQLTSLRNSCPKMSATSLAFSSPSGTRMTHSLVKCPPDPPGATSEFSRGRGGLLNSSSRARYLFLNCGEAWIGKLGVGWMSPVGKFGCGAARMGNVVQAMIVRPLGNTRIRV